MMSDEKDRARIIDLMLRLAPVAAEGALLVLRAESHVPPPAVEGWKGPETYLYGSMSLHFYEK
jgi:hypothetical protein